MSNQVRVEDLEVFSRFRAALLKFAQAADQSLGNADARIAGMRTWLENEQPSYWKGQLLKRERAVVQARDALRQKKLYKDYTGKARDAVEEEKVLSQCLAAVEEAQEKIEAIRKSLPRLAKATEDYRGGIASLGKTLTVDIPRAVAVLDRMALTLEQYVQIEAPAASIPEAPLTAGESMSRGGDAAEEPPPKVESAPPAVNPSKTPVQGEGRDVADGQ